MSDNNILDRLKAMRVALDAKDPLLQRGIEKDWVCVVSPAAVGWLEHMALSQDSEQHYNSRKGRLELITRRETWVIPMAEDNMAYMPKLTMFAVYADYFATKAAGT